MDWVSVKGFPTRLYMTWTQTRHKYDLLPALAMSGPSMIMPNLGYLKETTTNEGPS